MLNKVKKFFKSKKYLNRFWNLLVENRNVLKLAVPFVLMDIFNTLLIVNINYTNYLFYAPILFNICWMVLFIGLSMSFKGWIGKSIYLFNNLLFLIIFLANSIYYSTMRKVFEYSLIESAGEGAPYIMDSLKNANPFIYVAIIIIIISVVLCIKDFPNVKKNNYKLCGKILLIFFISHLIIPFTLGRVNKELTWSSWRNARNIYENFNDSNKSVKVCGFFEYNIRSFYITFLKPTQKITSEELEFLDNSYVGVNNIKNKYTGKYKNKNLIIIQLEGMDSWIVNKSDTPTIYKMMNNSINFTKHYSFYNGGGSTFNSEFAINTGFVTPFSYTKNAYTFNKNNFPYTLAKLFKERDYVVNAFHMNNAEYYSRGVNYENWGYDHYYGLKDLGDYKDNSYNLDRELMLNEKFSELLFPKDKKFVDYIITYSGHTPFTNTKGVCKQLYDLDIQKEMNETGSDVEPEFVEMTEEECIRRQNTETDYMMELLLQKLKDNNLLNDTVIVVITDHYLYTVTDMTILDRYKNTSNNLINNTPFFIWTNKTKKTNINEVTSQIDVLPTILNLFGFEYNVNNYLGKDALANKYKGIVFFNDYSWYDGNVYVENGSPINDKKIKEDELIEKNEYVNYSIKKNDLTLKYNYLK